MRLVLKHIARSIRRAPLQTAVVIFTLFLAAFTFAFSLSVMNALSAERQLQRASEYGRADISVTVSSASPSRFLSASALREIAGEGGLVSGYFSLPASVEGGYVWAAAADFGGVDGLFDFVFTEYGRVTEGTLNTSAFITQSFANAHGLKTGDAVTVRLLSTEKRFTVQGISRYPFFGQYDLLVNASGAVGILSAQSPVFAAFDGENLPYNALFARLVDPSSAAAVAEALQNTVYAGHVVSVHAGSTAAEYDDMLLVVVQTVMVALSVCVASIILYCSVNIISRKREEETKNFLLAGATARMTSAAFVAEMAAYLLVGGAAGLAVAALLLHAAAPWVGFVYAPVYLTPAAALFAAVASVAVVAIALVFHFSGLGRRAGRNRGAKTVALVALGGMIVAGLCFLLLPVRLHHIPAFASGICFILFVLSGVPLCMGRGFRKLAAAADGSRAPFPAPARYALKNLVRVKELHNACRLLCVVVTAVIGMSACFRYGNLLLTFNDRFLDCQYVAVNASQSCEEEIKNLPLTEECGRACFCDDATFPDGKTITLVSFGSAAFIRECYAPVRLPQGDQLLLPESVAKLYGFSVGDSVTLASCGRTLVFTLAGYTEGKGYFAYFDSVYYGLPRNILLIKSPCGDAAYERQLEEIASSDLALVGSADVLSDGQSSQISAFLRAFALFFACNVAISAVGVINLVGYGYARRKREFTDYLLCGTSRGELNQMIAFEVLLFIAVALAVSAAGGALVCAWINGGMGAFGYALF